MRTTMVEFNTTSDEATLFLLLTGRGQRADVPNYQSVESFDEDDGFVIFSRLDCAPAARFRVGVAGNYILTTKSFEREIVAWLQEGGVAYNLSEVVFDDPENAREFFRVKRENSKEGREGAIKKIKAGLKKQAEDTDKVLLNEHATS